MIIIIRLLFIIFLPVVCAISCKNAKGDDVDWFVGLKLPTLSKKHDVSGRGYKFLYLDKSSTDWSKPEEIGTKESAIGQTLGQLYPRTEDQIYILYNDQPPTEERVPRRKAHAKGVVYFGDDQGFWLIHSAPKFPPLQQYEYAENAVKYGQSFLCITMKTSQLRPLGKQLLYMDPFIYDSNLPNRLANKFPELKDLLPLKKRKKARRKVPGEKSIELIKSAMNMTFTSLVKSRTFNDDLYSGIVAPKLKSDLYVEAWRNGQGSLKSSCAERNVKNVLELMIGETKYSNSNDHSKWAVTVKPKKHKYVCIGDMNRQEGQLHRGGGTACFNHGKIHKLFLGAVKEVERCNK